VTDPTLVPTLARLARDAGVPDRADRLIALMEEVAASNSRARSLRAAALQAGGLLRDDVGLLLEAVSLLKDGPRRFATATAREDAARCLAARGEIGRATELYRRALEGYIASGATHATRRVRCCLRRGGVNRMPVQRGGTSQLWLGEPQRVGAAGDWAGCRWAHQPRSRGAAVHVPPYCGLSPPSRLRQAGCVIAGRPDPVRRRSTRGGLPLAQRDAWSRPSSPQRQASSGHGRGKIALRSPLSP
jgi:hypothetical protein